MEINEKEKEIKEFCNKIDYNLISKYSGAKIFIKIECVKCNKSRSQTWTNIKKLKNPCCSILDENVEMHLQKNYMG
jgi:hypothetical protein